MPLLQDFLYCLAHRMWVLQSLVIVLTNIMAPQRCNEPYVCWQRTHRYLAPRPVEILLTHAKESVQTKDFPAFPLLLSPHSVGHTPQDSWKNCCLTNCFDLGKRALLLLLVLWPAAHLPTAMFRLEPVNCLNIAKQNMGYAAVHSL